MTVAAEHWTAATHDAGLDADEVRRVVALSLAEDLALGPDVTTRATVAADARGRAVVRAREAGVLAGLPVALAVLEAVHGSWRLGVHRRDGDLLAPGDVVLEIDGPLVPLLRAERPALNLLSHLSGVATQTRRWVDALAGTGVQVRDTRKTTPGLRHLEKYAVRCGGGSNHRLALGDAALVKDNHVAAAGGVGAAVRAVRAATPAVPLQVECDTVAEVREALSAGATALLLDNMGLDDMRAAVALARASGEVAVEASGGLRLVDARAVAATGVDHVAVGALTHSAPILDLGLDLVDVHRGGDVSGA